MPEPISLRREGTVAVVISDSPPVNALSHAVRNGLVEAIDAANADGEVTAIVIACAGRTFFAGADISEFGKPVQDPDIHALMETIEGSAVPVVAAIHGTALGGGFELALASHYRVAVPSAKVGLPEVHLGILPGAGGTQRLPRLVGAQRALELITSGNPVKAAAALDLGMIDAIVPEGDLVDAAIAFARDLPVGAPPRVRDREDAIAADRGNAALFDDFAAANAARWRGFKAQPAIVEAVRAAVELPFEEGLARESALCTELMDSRESAAQRMFFFAERETARVPGLDKSVAPRSIEQVGVIGAGTMGSGIALAMLAGGLSVTIVETGAEALERGRAMVERTIEGQVKRGRLSREAADARLAAISYALEMDALADADLVIEAVFEDMGVKKEVFGKLDAVAKPGAILASNTSFLDIDEIARSTSRPGSVIGLHFFSPANVMRLLEIVRGEATEPDVLASAFALAKRTGKVGVLSGVCDGFIANRIMLPRALQAEALALEGTPVAAIDAVMRDYGFAMGHFQMMDLAGLDVVTRGQTERSLMGDLVAAGRLGQKSGAGFYDYDDKRRPQSSGAVDEAIVAFAAHAGIARKAPASEAEILDRLLLPVVNEGARILDEGIALRASDIDVAMVLGYGWPVYHGGPMFWATQEGLGDVVERLRALESAHGAAFTPSSRLLDAADKGSF